MNHAALKFHLVCLLAFVGGQPSQEPAANRYQITNIRVIDGDTIEGDVHLPFSVTLTKKRIRFLGVDTWETYGSTRPMGLDAKKYTEAMVKTGDVYGVPGRGKQEDNFGRLLMFIYVNQHGRWLNLSDSLIQRGHGTGVPEKGKKKGGF